MRLSPETEITPRSRLEVDFQNEIDNGLIVMLEESMKESFESWSLELHTQSTTNIYKFSSLSILSPQV